MCNVRCIQVVNGMNSSDAFFASGQFANNSRTNAARNEKGGTERNTLISCASEVRFVSSARLAAMTKSGARPNVKCGWLGSTNAVRCERAHVQLSGCSATHLSHALSLSLSRSLLTSFSARRILGSAGRIGVDQPISSRRPSGRPSNLTGNRRRRRKKRPTVVVRTRDRPREREREQFGGKDLSNNGSDRVQLRLA